MKHTVTYLVLCCALLCCLSARAFETDTVFNKRKARPENSLKERMFVPPIVIKTCITSMLTGGVVPYTAEYRLMMEITSGKKQSEQLAVSYLGKSVIVKLVEDSLKLPPNQVYKINGWRVQFAHKFFWISHRRYAPFGFYFAPLISYANARVSLGLQPYYKHAYYDFRNFNINGIIGVQAGKINRLTIDFYAGLGYKNNKVFYHQVNSVYVAYDTKDFGDFYNSHFNVVGGINLGYSF